MADTSTNKKRIEEYGVRSVKGRWSEWTLDGSGIECRTDEQTSGLSNDDLTWLLEPHLASYVPAEEPQPKAQYRELDPGELVSRLTEAMRAADQSFEADKGTATLGKDHHYNVDGVHMVVRGGSIEDFKRAALCKPESSPPVDYATRLQTCRKQCVAAERAEREPYKSHFTILAIENLADAVEAIAARLEAQAGAK